MRSSSGWPRRTASATSTSTSPCARSSGLHIDPALSLTGLRPAIPIIALFVVLLFLPPLRVRAGAQLQSREDIPSPPARRWLVAVVPMAATCYVVATVVSRLRTFDLGQGLALAIIMLSLVPLIGYAGQISLAPMAFAGIGAVAMGAWGGDGNPLGLVGAGVAAGVAGVIVALPALRLQGLYLALSTAAFAVFLDLVFFNQDLFMPNGNRSVPRVDLGPVSTDGDRAHLVFLGVVFCLVAVGVAQVRRSEFGRRLLAMKSSQAACTTLGVNLTATKVQVFALSAAIAGVGGALYGAQLRSVSPPTFQFLQSLPVVLLAVIGGIGAPGGALFGGITYTLSFSILPDLVPSLRTLLFLSPALAGVSLGRNPNGAVHETVRSVRRMRRARTMPDDRGEPRRDDVVVLEWLGFDRFDDADRAWLDARLGLAGEPR